MCEVCGGKPPDEAFIDDKEEKEKMVQIQAEKQKEEERVNRQREAEEKALRDAEIAKVKEEENKKLVLQKFQETQQYLKECVTQDFLFAKVD
jgi:hypothetical protein